MAGNVNSDLRWSRSIERPQGPLRPCPSASHYRVAARHTGSDQQNGDHRAMSDLIGDAAAPEVGQEAVTVGRHRDQRAPLPLRGGRDLDCRLAGGQHSLGGEPLGGELASNAFEVEAVVAHLFGFAQLEIAKIAGCPAVRHMDENQGRPAQSSQPAHVSEHVRVGRRVFERDQDAIVHAGGWWLVAGGWWLVAGGWWLVAGDQTSRAMSVHGNGSSNHKSQTTNHKPQTQRVTGNG